MPDFSQFPGDNEYERLIEEDQPVFAVSWDSGEAGAGAASEQVYRWGDGYIVVVSDGEDETVYPTLRDAIAETELNYINDATREITSLELSSEEAAELLQLRDLGRSYRILINGEPWQAEDSQLFRRAE